MNDETKQGNSIMRKMDSRMPPPGLIPDKYYDAAMAGTLTERDIQDCATRMMEWWEMWRVSDGNQRPDGQEREHVLGLFVRAAREMLEDHKGIMGYVHKLRDFYSKARGECYVRS